MYSIPARSLTGRGYSAPAIAGKVVSERAGASWGGGPALRGQTERARFGSGGRCASDAIFEPSLLPDSRNPLPAWNGWADDLGIQGFQPPRPGRIRPDGVRRRSILQAHDGQVASESSDRRPL